MYADRQPNIPYSTDKMLSQLFPTNGDRHPQRERRRRRKKKTLGMEMKIFLLNLPGSYSKILPINVGNRIKGEGLN